mgnify:CR=1 FL=1
MGFEKKLIKRESRTHYIKSLHETSLSSTYGYRLVYPVKSRPGKRAKPRAQRWEARIHISSLPVFPTVRPMIRDAFYEYTKTIRDSCSNHGIPNSFGKLFRVLFSETSRKFFQDLQESIFRRDYPNHTLCQYRKSWYHDSLLHRFRNPYMRLVRKCRLGVSELRSHSYYLNQGSKICPHCHTQQEETLEHFFLSCPAFIPQRTEYLAKVTPLLRELNLPITVASFLGFDHNLEHRNYSSQQLSLRRHLYRHTCDFFRLTNRFKFL